jgi:hypothetical protein
MHLDPRLFEYLTILRSRVNDRCLELAEETDQVTPVQFREEGFTAVVLEILEDLGQVAGCEQCYVDRRFGRGIGKINAWHLDPETRQLDLVTTIHMGNDVPEGVAGGEISKAVSRAVRIYHEAQHPHFREMEPASPVHDMMHRLNEEWHCIDRVQVVVIVDGFAGDMGDTAVDAGGAELKVEVWDLRRLYRAESSGLSYEPVEIDLEQRLGSALPCIETPSHSADYRSYVAIIPGNLLHSLYHEFGPRLLELNVRSFLQARGKVNQGIRDTLRAEPDRFMAYNNGISITAEELDLQENGSGFLAIRKITGLQIVNGGQTVASIHRAGEQDKVDLSCVFVQAKITLVSAAQIETLVPLVSRFANTQNKVNEADFSANHPFHVRIQQLSETVWAPGEQTRWFYERARGQYEVARARDGSTPARRRRFDETTPMRQKFDKVLLAKVFNAWDQLPHIVSRGGQKNFVHFMQRLPKSHGADWEPDSAYYRRLVARAILYKRAERVARAHKFPAYRANAIAYTLSLVSYRTAGRVDLEGIWNRQEVSESLANVMYDWMAEVYDEIIASAGQRNITEWCKKEDCWRQIQTLSVSVPRELEDELSEGQPLPTVGDTAGRSGVGLTAEDRENIARVMQVSAQEWIHICEWGAQSEMLAHWQIGIATTLASYAATGWNRVPSQRQARFGVEIIRIADSEGGRGSEDL